MSDTPSSLEQVPGVVPVSSVAGTTPPATSTTGGNTLKNSLDSIMAWLSSAPFLHVAGMASLTALMMSHTVPVAEGLPLLAGLIGLGINTTPSSSP